MKKTKLNAKTEELKIFEKYPLKECIKDCLDAGYFPATKEEFLKHRKKGRSVC